MSRARSALQFFCFITAHEPCFETPILLGVLIVLFENAHEKEPKSTQEVKVIGLSSLFPLPSLFSKISEALSSLKRLCMHGKMIGWARRRTFARIPGRIRSSVMTTDNLERDAPLRQNVEERRGAMLGVHHHGCVLARAFPRWHRTPQARR